mmetsp:Transcript_48352/g.149212  ORF Transcript_48352/g.149212 Transcript_48352/m.149212 type:complete len:253 (+) Transcript_48352:294-1052(+)
MTTAMQATREDALSNMAKPRRRAASRAGTRPFQTQRSRTARNRAARRRIGTCPRRSRNKKRSSKLRLSTRSTQSLPRRRVRAASNGRTRRPQAQSALATPPRRAARAGPPPRAQCAAAALTPRRTRTRHTPTRSSRARHCRCQGRRSWSATPHRSRSQASRRLRRSDGRRKPQRRTCSATHRRTARRMASAAIAATTAAIVTSAPCTRPRTTAAAATMTPPTACRPDALPRRRWPCTSPQRRRERRCRTGAR